MSWSVQIIGDPKNVRAALDEYEQGLNGQSKEEFSTVKDHIASLVEQNSGPVYVKLAASGHGNYAQGSKISGVCSVSIDAMYGKIV